MKVLKKNRLMLLRFKRILTMSMQRSKLIWPSTRVTKAKAQFWEILKLELNNCKNKTKGIDMLMNKAKKKLKPLLQMVKVKSKKLRLLVLQLMLVKQELRNFKIQLSTSVVKLNKIWLQKLMIYLSQRMNHQW